jgi:TPR repeat protein
MKKILLLLLFLGIILHLNASSFKEDKKACNDGIAEGCYNLGLMYAAGQGVRQDYSKAKELFGKACDGEYEDGCKNYVILNKR